MTVGALMVGIMGGLLSIGFKVGSSMILMAGSIVGIPIMGGPPKLI